MRRGFTVIEMLIVLGVVFTLVAISIPVFTNFQEQTELDIALNDLVQRLRRAQTLSRSAVGDSQWGVYAQAGSITLFKGSTFASRDVAYDEVTEVSPNLSFQGNTEIVFNKVTGFLPKVQNIYMSSVNGLTGIVGVTEKGAVSFVFAESPPVPLPSPGPTDPPIDTVDPPTCINCPGGGTVVDLQQI